ncbi:SMI1/KNR4 family protein [Streptomyces abyssomicinicus]|uniref:SMI1/KNR4 family protein n=1 Tax=Streptomyces abyssomicinicus TaxID=574929 RepID=UPI00124FDB54|nr:SMI1/KNR4 family protein [Streptomyces abyssomicinicus]
MTDETFDWPSFLKRWQEEWDPDPERSEPSVLGRPAAAEETIAAAERRLGMRLPPSYRGFLAASDGWWVGAIASVYRLGGVQDVDRHDDPYGLAEVYEECLDDDPTDEEVLLAGMWRRALRLETEGDDGCHALLDPGDTGPDGEWALYVYQGWGGEHPVRYPSFRAYMEAMYRAFHARSAGSGRPFVNATTREQDARVDRAREAALCGRWEEAEQLLAQAAEFGRPGARGMLDQIRHLQGRPYLAGFHGLLDDPRYSADLVPALVAAENGMRGRPSDITRRMLAARVPGAEASVLDPMTDGTYRYLPPGAFGEAVTLARELARWGDIDAAWRMLLAALPAWVQPGPELIAPVGLLGDPLLGSLITPERGLELLATPRAGGSGPAPDLAGDLDPPGLTWLTESSPGWQAPTGYRCVWVEGVEPAGLPELIGEEGAEMGDLVDAGRIRLVRRRDEEAQPWEDRARAAVGRGGEGWAFAFEPHPPSGPHERYVSPAVEASHGSRAVVVWSTPTRYPGGSPAVFHLSVAEDGVEQYAFTVRGTEIELSGVAPETLDPDRLFTPGEQDGSSHGQTGERRALAAISGEFGLHLPRFALTRGRVHTLTTRSWAREPRKGEAYAYIVFGRTRPS